MTSRRSFLLGSLPVLALAGCASGPRMADMASRIPPIPQGKARIWFYRSASPVGSAVQPPIRVNGQVVGTSTPNGAFFRDVDPGDIRVTTETEAERVLTFTIAAGEERYVRTFVMPGFFVGHVGAELVDATEARPEVASKAFTGAPP